MRIVAASGLASSRLKSLPSPEASSPSMRAAMAAIALPAKLAAQPQLAAKLHDRLLERHRIEVPVNLHAGRLWLRISAQIYNELAEYEHLGWALAAEID